MSKFDESIVGQDLVVTIDGEKFRCRATHYIGDKEPNPGRELVEVRLIDYVEGADPLEIFDAFDLDRPAANPSGRNACHYCGGPASSFDFFDAPVCRGCS